MERKAIRQHPFDIMIRGRQEDSIENDALENLQEEAAEDSEGNGDIISHIETLMGAVSELKPLYNKVLPYINKWTKS